MKEVGASTPIKTDAPLDPVHPCTPIQPLQPTTPLQPLQPESPPHPVHLPTPLQPLQLCTPLQQVERVDPVEPLEPVEPVIGRHSTQADPVDVSVRSMQALSVEGEAIKVSSYQGQTFYNVIYIQQIYITM